MTTLPRFKCVPRCFGPINMDICKLMLCAIEYTYFTGQILHEHAADFQKRKPFEVGCNKFLLFWHVLLNWYVELYFFLILINFPKLNDKFRRKKVPTWSRKMLENCLSRKPPRAINNLDRIMIKSQLSLISENSFCFGSVFYMYIVQSCNLSPNWTWVW